MKKLSEQELQFLAEEKKALPNFTEQSSELNAYLKVNEFLQKEQLPSLSPDFSQKVVLKIRQNSEVNMEFLEWGFVLFVAAVSFGCIGWVFASTISFNWADFFTLLFGKTSSKSWVSLVGVLFLMITWSEIEEIFSIRPKQKLKPTT